MSLELRIDEAIKEAMKAKQASRLRALRDIKSQIVLAQTDGSGQEVNEERELKILNKMHKQRVDSLEIYMKQNREDLATKEREEMIVIEEFLPARMSQEDLDAAISAIITQIGAAGPGDMGKVMGAATKQLNGKADGRTISETVKKLLNNL